MRIAIIVLILSFPLLNASANYWIKLETTINKFVDAYNNADNSKQELIKSKIINAVNSTENKEVKEFLLYFITKLVGINWKFEVSKSPYSLNWLTRKCRDTWGSSCYESNLVSLEDACLYENWIHQKYIDEWFWKVGNFVKNDNQIIYWDSIKDENWVGGRQKYLVYDCNSQTTEDFFYDNDSLNHNTTRENSDIIWFSKWELLLYTARAPDIIGSKWNYKIGNRVNWYSSLFSKSEVDSSLKKLVKFYFWDDVFENYSYSIVLFWDDNKYHYDYWIESISKDWFGNIQMIFTLIDGKQSTVEHLSLTQYRKILWN